MKRYIKSFTTVFLGVVLVLHIVIFIGLFGMWQLDRFTDMYSSDGFWSFIRMVFIMALVVPLFANVSVEITSR